jgi:hypothetical protein
MVPALAAVELRLFRSLWGVSAMASPAVEGIHGVQPALDHLTARLASPQRRRRGLCQLWPALASTFQARNAVNCAQRTTCDGYE